MAANVAWLKDILGRVDAAKTARPDTSEKLVSIPNGVERLKQAVLSVRKVVRELQFERTVIERDQRETIAEYERALAVIMKEYEADCDKNDCELANAHERLTKLWQEWIRISKDDIGIYAALPGAEMPEAPPLPTRQTTVVDAEWSDQEH